MYHSVTRMHYKCVFASCKLLRHNNTKLTKTITELWAIVHTTLVVNLYCQVFNTVAGVSSLTKSKGNTQLQTTVLT